MRKILLIFLTLVLFGSLGYGTIKFYSYIFARRVSGEVVAVERVTDPSMIFNTGAGTIPPNMVFSFSVAIRTADGEIVAASSEDSKWMVVQKGNHVDAEYFPYPPWDLAKRGTYFGARLLRIWDNNSPKQ